MKERIIKHDPSKEYYFQEGCHIIETLNTPDDPDLSIARARVEPGITTKWHRLKGIVERYLILHGTGRVEVGALPPQIVTSGDGVVIPDGCRQRITNIGDDDLIFLAICTPRFSEDRYEEI